jgi:hypothetical protein
MKASGPVSPPTIAQSGQPEPETRTRQEYYDVLLLGGAMKSSASRH